MTARLSVLKTYKLFIGGAFPRSESGRTVRIVDHNETVLAHVCHGSRKDLRDAVSAARSAADGWAGRNAYNRGQILYRMAEMLEGRTAEFTELLAATTKGGRKRAQAEVARAVERLVSFAGWTDKFTQVLGCSNPVAGPYYNFTIPEPTGVVAVIAPDEEPLLGLISLIAPVICSGNTIVVIASSEHPLASAVFAEVCATSDVPGGVVNILTGQRDELLDIVSAHRGIDAIHAAGLNPDDRTRLELGRSENVKRVLVRSTAGKDWYDDNECQSPYWIEPFVEYKTIWHPSAC